MEKMKKKISLDIANSRITIVTDEDEEYVKSLAKLVSSKVNALSLSGNSVTKTDAALVYALELLDENCKLKMELAEMKNARNGK
ncbi:MAG: cell division protein ZapA [Clostridia bacterium]|nr:cell division protein ZapA [Clostridia bacterium]